MPVLPWRARNLERPVSRTGLPGADNEPSDLGTKSSGSSISDGREPDLTLVVTHVPVRSRCRACTGMHDELLCK